MKWFIRFVFVVALVFCCWWLWQRIFVTDEDRVHRQLAAMTHAVETGNLITLENNIAHDYTDDYGFDKATIIGGVKSFRSQYDKLLIFISDLKIEVAPDRQHAQAVFIAKVLAKAHGEFRESEVQGDRYKLYFHKTDGGWKLTRVESPKLKFD